MPSLQEGNDDGTQQHTVDDTGEDADADDHCREEQPAVFGPLQREGIEPRGQGHEQEAERVVVERDDDGGEQETEQNGGCGNACRGDLPTEGHVGKEDGARQGESLQHAEALQPHAAEELLPDAAQQSRQVVVEVVGHGCRVLEDVQIERVRESGIGVVDALQSHEQPEQQAGEECEGNDSLVHFLLFSVEASALSGSSRSSVMRIMYCCTMAFTSRSISS